MALKHFKPTTPGQRQLVLIDRSDLYKGKPVKKLVEATNSTGGRNNAGRITSFQKGGGHKRAYRVIDFKRRKFDMSARVERLETDEIFFLRDKLCFVLRLPGFGLVERRLELARVDLGKDVALFDVLAFLKQHVLQLAVDLRMDADRKGGLHGAEPGEIDRDVLP